MRISYWSSDVCSSDLRSAKGARAVTLFPLLATLAKARATLIVCKCSATARRPRRTAIMGKQGDRQDDRRRTGHVEDTPLRSEEHTSELQSLMRNSYAVFCLTKKKEITINTYYSNKHTTKNKYIRK